MIKTTRYDKIFSMLQYVGATFGFFGMLYAAVVLYIPSQLLTVPYRGGFLLLAVFLFFRYRISQARPMYSGVLVYAFVAFWILYLVAILIEPVDHLFQPKSTYLKLIAGGILVPSLVFLFSKTATELRVGHQSVLCMCAIVGLSSFFLYGDASGLGRAEKGEFIGGFVTLGPLQLSYLGSVSILLGLNCFLDRQVFRWRVVRFGLAALLLIFGAFQISIGASRGAVVAVVVVSFIVIFARVRSTRSFFGSLGGLCIVVIAGGLVVVFSENLGSALFDRLMKMMYTQDAYTFGGHGIGRIYLYHAAIEQFLERPLFGGGLSIRGMFTYPHNGILEAFMATGVLGGVLFTAYFFGVARRAIFLIRYHPSLAWVSILYLHYAINIMFSSNLSSNTYFWYTSMMVIGVSEFCGVKENDRHAKAR